MYEVKVINHHGLKRRKKQSSHHPITTTQSHTKSLEKKYSPYEMKMNAKEMNVPSIFNFQLNLKIKIYYLEKYGDLTLTIECNIFLVQVKIL